jgi:hypothetical protein
MLAAIELAALQGGSGTSHFHRGIDPSLSYIRFLCYVNGKFTPSSTVVHRFGLWPAEKRVEQVVP